MVQRFLMKLYVKILSYKLKHDVLSRVSDPDPPRSVSVCKIQIRIHKTFDYMDPDPVAKPTPNYIFFSSKFLHL